MDVVLIPCWRRPEMLWHCLEHIKRAEGAEAMHYIFRIDTGYSPELKTVIDGFPFSHELAETPRTMHRKTKQSYSVLTGYRLAAQKSDGLVFLIEEDIFIATDFFKWHKAVHAQQPDLFCSIAVKNHNRTINLEGADDEYYLTTLDYCSWGVCFDVVKLMNFVLPMASQGYYNDPHGFMRLNFRGAPINEGHVEQDGLIRRIQWWHGMDLPIAYPFQARAYHAGLYGYNRGNPPQGSLSKRIEYVAQTCYSHQTMRILAERPEYVDDSEPIELNAQPWQELKQVILDLDQHPRRV